MSKNGLPIGEAVDFGWKAFRKTPGAVLAAGLVAIVIPAFVVSVGHSVTDGKSLPSFAMDVAYMLLCSTIVLGLLSFCLQMVDGKRPGFETFFEIFPRAPFFLVAWLLTMIVVAFGLVLLIVPGIILFVRLMMTPFYIIEHNAGPFDAMQRSWDITRGFAFDLFFFSILMLGVLALGVMALGAGVFVALPVCYLAMAWMYRHLVRYDQVRQAPPEVPAA